MSSRHRFSSSRLSRRTALSRVGAMAASLGLGIHHDRVAAEETIAHERSVADVEALGQEVPLDIDPLPVHNPSRPAVVFSHADIAAIPSHHAEYTDMRKVSYS